MHTLRLGLQAFLVFVFVTSIAGAQAAAAPNPAPAPRGWMKAASLRPGERLRVQVRFARAPTLCTLVWIDNTALACDEQAVSGVSARVIFPAAQVYSVERARAEDCNETCGAGKRLLIGAGVGGTLGGLLLSQNSGRAAAFGAMLGAGVGGGMALGPPSFGSPARPVMGFRVPLRRPGRIRVP